MTDSFFMKILEYGEAVGLEGATEPEFFKWANSLRGDGHSEDIHEAQKQNTLQNVFNECFDTSSMTEKNDGSKKDQAKYVLKPKYYFRLIEYRKFQENRKTLESANRNSLAAIGISVVAIILCLILTFTQRSTPVSINQSDLQALVNLNHSNNIQKEIKLDKLQMEKILSAIEYKLSEAKTPQSNPKIQSNEIGHHELINKYFEAE